MTDERTVEELIEEIKETVVEVRHSIKPDTDPHLAMRAGCISGLAAVAVEKLRELENKRIVYEQRYRGMVSEWDRLRAENQRGRDIEIMFDGLIGAIKEERGLYSAEGTAIVTARRFSKIATDFWAKKMNHGKEKEDDKDV